MRIKTLYNISVLKGGFVIDSLRDYFETIHKPLRKIHKANQYKRYKGIPSINTFQFYNLRKITYEYNCNKCNTKFILSNFMSVKHITMRKIASAQESEYDILFN